MLSRSGRTLIPPDQAGGTRGSGVETQSPGPKKPGTRYWHPTGDLRIFNPPPKNTEIARYFSSPKDKSQNSKGRTQRLAHPAAIGTQLRLHPSYSSHPPTNPTRPPSKTDICEVTVIRNTEQHRATTAQRHDIR